MTPPPDHPADGRGGRTRPRRAVLPWWALACLTLVAVAVVMEVTAAGMPGPQEPSLLWPPGWSAPARATWWSAVAAAAAGYGVAEHRAGVHRHPIVRVATVLPFAVLAVAAGLGAGWATWR
jgi:hypothetical protein